MITSPACGLLLVTLRAIFAFKQSHLENNIQSQELFRVELTETQLKLKQECESFVYEFDNIRV